MSRADLQDKAAGSQIPLRNLISVGQVVRLDGSVSWVARHGFQSRPAGCQCWRIP